MATDSTKTSSDTEISFSEWQFVVKNKGECSDDDESIEIIEREVLQSVTPSSCSEDENEKDDDIEVVDWEAPVEDGRIQLNNEEFVVNPSLVEGDTDQPTNCLYSSEDDPVTATSINNNFSRKVLYSCVLAAVIGVVIHQYRGNLLGMLNRVYAKSEVNEPSLQDGVLCMQAEMKQQPIEHKIHSDDAIVQDLVNKREQFKKLCEKYELILSNTFIPKSNIYAVEMSVLRNIYGVAESLDMLDNTPCEIYIDNMQLPAVCTDSSGKLFLIMEKLEYNELMRKVLNSMQFDEHKMHESLNNLIRMNSKSEHLRVKPLPRLISEIPVDDSNDEISTNEINVENIQSNEVVDSPLIKDDTILTNENEIDVSEIRKKGAAVELQIQEIIEEIRTLGRKMKTQVDDFHRLWTICNKNEQNSCVLKNELASEENDTLATESEKINATHTEEINPASVSDFIYKSAPITDRWSLKMDSKPSEDSKLHDKTSGEWLLRMNKAREKYRKRHKEKGGKQKTHTSYDKTVHEIYKRYREAIAKTQEKIKADYKKYSSQFKSKLKKFGDGMKRSYEKFISSDWKHYANTVMNPFRF